MDQDPKTNSGPGTPVDLRTWAAYVLGCQPRIIHIRQEELATQLCWGNVPGSREPLLRLYDAVGQMDEAVGVLAERDLLSPKTLHLFHCELRNYLDSVVFMLIGAVGDTLEDPDDIVLDPGDTLAYLEDFVLENEWRRLDQASRSLSTGDENLDRWWTLGQRLGDFLVNYSVTDDDLDSKRREFEDIAGQIGERFEASVGQSANNLAGAVSSCLATESRMSVGFREDFNRLIRLSVAILEEHIRFALRAEAAPEPVLILNRDSWTIFGKPIPKVGRGKGIALLWRLAEEASHPVDREVLIKAMDTDRDPINLKYEVNTLRNLLRILIDEHYNETGLDRPPHAEMAFILGSRSGRTTKRCKHM